MRDLRELFLESVNATDPGVLVKDWFEGRPERAFGRVVALGKAAWPMAFAASSRVQGAGLVISPYPADRPETELLEGWEFIQSSHPFLDERAFRAGQRLLEFVSEGSGDLLFLISGGGSALVEVAPPGVPVSQVIAEWRRLYTAGLAIDEMNRQRASHSLIKGGKLLASCNGPSHSLVLSDVLQGANWVASGLTYSSTGNGEHGFEVLADGHRLLQELASRLQEQGLDCRLQEPLLGSIAEAEASIKSWQPRRGQAYLASAEVVVALPSSPLGLGGRCQELVLRLLPWLRESPLMLLAAASDGIDGPTLAAGAWADGDTWCQARERGLVPEEYLARHDSFGFFRDLGQSWQPGPTHNNLNDLIVLVHS